MDALSENYEHLSSFVYTYNNPINFKDILGLAPGDPKVGADGLTNEQWMKSSNPSTDRNMAGSFKKYNAEKERQENAKTKLPEGKMDWNAPGADETNEMFRIYGKDKKTHIFYDTWEGFWYHWIESILDFEGVPINNSDIGELKYGAAFTLPVKGIYLSFDYYNSVDPRLVRDLFRHEYGHALSYKRYGFGYFPNVAISSIISAKSSGNHMNSWSEKEANTLSYYMLNSPKNWNFETYLIDYNYLNAINNADWKK